MSSESEEAHTPTPTAGGALLLPAPSETHAETKVLTVDSNTIKLDELGPMVVNSDGTLLRIANWASMTEAERGRTLKVLGARNRLRIESKKQQEVDGSS